MRMGLACPTMARTMAALPGMRTRFVPEPRRGGRGSSLDEPRVFPLEDRDDVGHRHIGVHTALAHVLHVAPAGAVIGLEDRVLAAVELERGDTEPLAERSIERRGGLDPALLQLELDVAVVVEHVAADQGAQPRR